MILVEILKWKNDKAICLVYADTADQLGPKVINDAGKELTLFKGSMAYLANGDVYVLGETWAKIGG